MKNQINTTKRVALYARVSTLDKGQAETQLIQLPGYAQARNFEVITDSLTTLLEQLRTELSIS